MSKRIARIMRRAGRSHTGEKSAVGASLPEPQRDQRQVHWQQNKRKKQVDPVQTYEDTDGIEPRVVSKQIPTAHRPVKMLPIPDPIVLPNATCDRPRREQ